MSPRRRKGDDPPVGAERAVQFINRLTHTKGPFAGQDFNLRPWQEQIIRGIFTTRPDGRRHYRTSLLMLPRKNGKTELAAGMVLYALLSEGEVGAEVYSAAADRDQASLVFNAVAQMIRHSPVLSAICEIVDSQRRVLHRASGSFYRAISAEAYSKHGFNASFVVYDELHAAPDRRLWDVLATSMGARANPILLAISTAGYDRHSILWELYTHAQKVLRDPTLDPTFLPIIYEAPHDADWLDERVWHAANPALGDFRSLEEMQTMAARAREIPGQENAFRRLYLNQWTEQSERWLQMEKWDACRGDLPDLTGADCIAGVDLASTTDIAACVLVFPHADGRVLVQPYFWVPEEGMAKRAIRDRVPYDVWARQGFIRPTPGNVIQYDRIRADVQELATRYHLRAIGFDPWNAEQIRQQLETDGFETMKIPPSIPGMNEATKRLGDLIVNRQLVHDGHPVLRWMASNMVVTGDANGNIRPDKGKSSEKIDGIVAMVIALATWLRQPGVTEPSYQMLVFGGR